MSSNVPNDLFLNNLDDILQTSPSKAAHTVLLVDDEVNNLQLLKRTLRGKYNILTASNGKEGLEVLENNVDRISLIVSDHKIKMPPVVTVDMAMPRYLFSSHIEKLEELYDDSIYVNIITKTDFYTDMVLTARPYTLNAKNVDRPIVRCRFEKVVRIVPEYLSVKLTANPFDANTIAAGNKNPVAINYDVTTQSFIS